MTASQKRFIRDWVRILCGHEDARITFSDITTQCRVSYSYKNDKNGNITNLHNIKFLFPTNFDSTKILDYLDKEKVEIIKTFSVELFIILHEIGHVVCAEGMNSKMKREEMRQVMSIKNFALQSKMYRQTTFEKSADNWAINWMVTHPREAKRMTQFLNNCLQK